MIKILKGSRFAVISHRFQQLIPILIWGFRIFSNSRTIVIRGKSTKWKASYSNNQTIAYKKKRGCWFTHFTMTTQSQLHTGLASKGEIMVVEWQIGERSRAEIAIFGFGFFCFDSEKRKKKKGFSASRSRRVFLLRFHFTTTHSLSYTQA